MDAGSWAAWVEATSLAEWMRSSPLAYPVANVAHLFGLVLFLGPIVMLDLRLLGFGRAFALPLASDLLTKWALAGIALLAIAGVLMFVADATALVANTVMQLKVSLIVIGAANALIFRRLWHRRFDHWDAESPLWGRVQAGSSILIWLAVGTLGRWIAYA